MAAVPDPNLPGSNSHLRTTPVGGSPMADRVSVSRLVELAQAGDGDAFGRLYHLYRASILRTARFQLGEGAEDAVAETFLRAWSALPRYRDTGRPFLAWLYGIARHVILDEQARRRRVQPVGEPEEEGRETGVEDRLHLAAAMERLPEGHRRVLELKFLRGLSNAEIGALIGRTPGAVNAMQWRALGWLRAMLEER